MTLLCRMPLAPCNGTTSTPPKLVVMLGPNHSTLQWHPAMARPLPQSSPPTIAHYNGTQQWHHVHSPKVGRWSSPSPQPYHTTMAPYDGTQQWHHVHSPNPPLHCTLQWHPGATSNQPKWFVALPPYWK